jgi:hypothetical protein
MASVALLFAVSNVFTRWQHASFGPADVLEALETLFDEEPHSMDDWDLFLSWPIKDSYCEHVRQECVRALTECPPVANEFVSDDAARRIRVLLEDVRRRVG